MNSEKTPQWKIDEMRKLYLDRSALNVADILGVSERTVLRYCKDIIRPSGYNTKVLLKKEAVDINGLLASWS